MLPGNIEEIYNEVNSGTSGEIIYQPGKVAVTGEGRIYLGVHADVHDRRKYLEKEAKKLMAAIEAESTVDRDKVRTSLKTGADQAEDVTLGMDEQRTSQTAQQADFSCPEKRQAAFP